MRGRISYLTGSASNGLRMARTSFQACRLWRLPVHGGAHHFHHQVGEQDASLHRRHDAPPDPSHRDATDRVCLRYGPKTSSSLPAEGARYAGVAEDAAARLPLPVAGLRLMLPSKAMGIVTIPCRWKS